MSKSDATGTPPSQLVEGSDLHMRFADGGIEALGPLDLKLRRGEVVSVVGPSGCGKSTLLRLVAGLIAPTSGTLTVAGLPPDQARREQHALSFVFQQAALLPWRTAEQNVALPMQLGGAPRDQIRARVAEMLKLVGLAEFPLALPRQLSGGMQMRVSLARALATKPSILLLDEPFGALDDITRQRLNEELLAIWAECGFTVLFVTHNVSEAVFLSQRILVMTARPGRLAHEIEVPFDYPRRAQLRAQADFAALTGKVSRALEGAHKQGGAE